MPCYGCGTSFGTFKKEKGCKNCGFAFCSKCLSHKAKVPKRNNENHNVCMKCFNILTGTTTPSDNDAKYSPPANFIKRVEALKEREVAGGSSHSVLSASKDHDKIPASKKAKYKGMSQADIDIAERLEKLREKPGDKAAVKDVSVKDIDHRLARLKGMDPSRYGTKTKATLPAPDRRTQQEQLDDLLQEISDEVEIEEKLDPAREIAARLARLREVEGPASSKTEPKGATGNTGATTAEDENNLNRKTNSDSQPFLQNIGGGIGNSSSASNNVTSANKPSNQTDEGEISVEEMKKLIDEAARELEVDAAKAIQGLEQDKEIMKKLKEIKQKSKESSTDVNKDETAERSDSDNEDNDEKAADKIIQQFLAESKLDEAAAKDGVSEKTYDVKSKEMKAKKKLEDEYEDDDDDDELPYCIICTEDATIRCYDCDRDLYCNKCFREGHKDLGLDDHQSAKYIQPKDKT